MGSIVGIVAPIASIIFPPAAPFISAGVAALGVVTQLSGVAGEARAQRASGAYARQVAENNAIIQVENARRAGVRTKEIVADQARQGLRFTSRQIVALAANGVVVDDGSAVDLVRDGKEQFARNVSRLRQTGVEDQTSLLQGAAATRQAGFIAQVTAENKARGAEGKISSILTEAGSTVSKKWGEFFPQDDDPGDLGDILTLSGADAVGFPTRLEDQFT